LINESEESQSEEDSSFSLGRYWGIFGVGVNPFFNWPGFGVLGRGYFNQFSFNQILIWKVWEAIGRVPNLTIIRLEALIVWEPFREGYKVGWVGKIPFELGLPNFSQRGLGDLSFLARKTKILSRFLIYFGLKKVFPKPLFKNLGPL